MELQLAVREAAEDAPNALPYVVDLGEELAELDNVEVALRSGMVPNGAKSAGSLTSLIARAPADGIGTLFRFLRAWVIRTGRTVEVSIGGDTIKITGASEQQQDRVIEAWLARHAAGS